MMIIPQFPKTKHKISQPLSIRPNCHPDNRRNLRNTFQKIIPQYFQPNADEASLNIQTQLKIHLLKF